MGTRLTEFGLTEEVLGLVPDGMVPGLVTVVNRTNCRVETEKGETLAELTGRFRFAAESSLDLPAVGDWVVLHQMDDFSLVTDLLPRVSVLRRRRPGSESGFQMLAANLSGALILHGCNIPVNVRRLERFAAMARDGGVEPHIVLSKADLLTGEERQAALGATSHLGPAHFVNSLAEGGADVLQRLLVPRKSYALLGPSGAGKTTLLNRLLGTDAYATGHVRSGDGKGRHTTTSRHLVRLPSGALIIDTPGVRELGMTDMQEGIDDTFADIAALQEHCRFRDCSHQQEAGCAVLAAVEAGEIWEQRLRAFQKLEREAAHYERSVVERRQKDKELGKMYKRVIQGKKDRR